MKKITLSITTLALLSLSSCQIAGGIFKAGVWVGIIIVVAIIAIIVMVIGKAGK